SRIRRHVAPSGHRFSTTSGVLSLDREIQSAVAPTPTGQLRAPLNEPQGRAGVSPASVGNADGMESLALARSLGRRYACPTLGAFRGSGSQCKPKSKRSLSTNRPTPPPPSS